MSLFSKSSPKESKLLSSLKVVISGLEEDMLHYSWIHPQSCNCSLVIQALTDKNRHQVETFYNKGIKELAKHDIKLVEESATWKKLCQLSCSVTGEPLTKVFKELKKLGLRSKDIVHLEFLSNIAICELSGIDRTEHSYYEKRKNLIKYLKGWVMILENDYDETVLTESAVKEAKELIAVAFNKTV